MCDLYVLVLSVLYVLRILMRTTSLVLPAVRTGVPKVCSVVLLGDLCCMKKYR